MKKIILLAAISLLGITANAQANAQANAKTSKVDGAGMVFETETINYGTVAANSDGTREFVFTNNGNQPLTITKTFGSCGCTIPTKPEKSIQPGEKGSIKVHYDTKRAGQPFTKTVTVISNAVGQENKVLTITGTVLPLTPSDTAAVTKS